MQGTDIDISLYDIFNDDELFALWQTQNLNQYLRKGPSSIGGELALSIAKPMLKDFLDKASHAIKNAEPAADLRFAHGENIMPFTALIGIDGASTTELDPSKVYIAWNDFKITSMASNVQWISIATTNRK